MTPQSDKVNSLKVHFYPANLLITTAVIIPNLLFLFILPLNEAHFYEGRASGP